VNEMNAYEDVDPSVLLAIDPLKLQQLMGRADAARTSDVSPPIVLYGSFRRSTPPYLLSVVTDSRDAWVFVVAADVTNAGFLPYKAHRQVEPTTTSLVIDLHAQSGLTWEELSRLLGRDKRSLHLWARGSRMSPSAEKRLRQISTLIRSLDARSPGETRARLMEPQADSESWYSMIARTAKIEDEGRLKKGRGKRASKTAKTSAKPGELLGALHDSVDVASGPFMGVKPLRPTKR
jgi:hypothetical protein